MCKFTLNLEGGSKGLIENSETLCARAQVAIEQIAGQNGKHVNGRRQDPNALRQGQ